MLINAFFWGAIGGLFMELIEYYQKFKHGDFDDQENVFWKKYKTPCLISMLIGGVIAYAISLTPSEIWALVIGATAIGTISKLKPTI